MAKMTHTQQDTWWYGHMIVTFFGTIVMGMVAGFMESLLFTPISVILLNLVWAFGYLSYIWTMPED